MGYYEPYAQYGVRRREPSIFDGFTLSPLPYPVILILIVISIFLAIKFYFSFEEAAETAELQINWLLLVTPLVLIFAVRWLSSMKGPLFGMSLYGRGTRPYCGRQGSSDGASPWGVAALIVLLLVLVQYQSIFLDSWFI